MPKKTTQEQIDKIIEMRKQSIPRKDIALAMNMPLSRIKDILLKNEVVIDPKVAQQNAYRAIISKNPNAMTDMRKNINIEHRSKKIKEAYSKQELRELKKKQTENWWANLSDEDRQAHLDSRYESFINSEKVAKYFNRSGVDGADPASSFAHRVEFRGGTVLGQYTGSKERVEVLCSKGHKFNCMPNSLQQGFWCPKCSSPTSKGQLEVADFIRSLVKCEVIVGDRNAIAPKELDVFVPDKNFAIEFNGLFWHSSALDRYKRSSSYDKWKACADQGITLISIFEDEWKNQRHLLEDMIKVKLGVWDGVRLNARDCKVVSVSKDEADHFFQDNHMSGPVNHKEAIGLLFNDRLVSCASFRVNFNNEFEIARFATARGFIVRGGLSKILSHCSKNEIVSFSDNRFSIGTVYQSVGFQNITKSGATNSYFYTDGNNRYWRFACRKNNDPEIVKQSPTEESQAVDGFTAERLLGVKKPLFRIDDAGHQKWIFRKPS